MERATYDELAERIRLLAGLASSFDPNELDEFIRINDQTHTIAPILAPTAYMAGHERVDAMTALARAVARLRAAAIEFRDVVEKTEAKAQRARDEARAILGGGS